MTNHSCTIHPDVVDDVAKRMVRGETLNKMSAFLKVMADPTRLSIVSALLIREMCVCDLAKLLDMEHSADARKRVIRENTDMKKVFALEDLDCANCAAKMENAVSKIDGVNAVNVSFIMQRMTLEADDERFDEVVKEVVKKCRRIEPDCKIKV